MIVLRIKFIQTWIGAIHFTHIISPVFLLFLLDSKDRNNLGRRHHVRPLVVGDNLGEAELPLRHRDVQVNSTLIQHRRLENIDLHLLWAEISLTCEISPLMEGVKLNEVLSIFQ